MLFHFKCVNLSYLKPDSIDDGPIYIYNALAITFDGVINDAKISCYDSEKKYLKTTEKHTIMHMSVIISCYEIENVSYIKIKIGKEETDYIEVSKKKKAETAMKE
ncbi:hypothetical protein NGRA_0404 [Nosema granulosis]|uniref:Uncharacterized protein n=1 Tax=Nosema granulosis TaxID=83296 RepID=A0A9P6H0E7_9MICR|nr:hypothetical protein NGRA_0404 [Nosema granulosis]